MVVDAKGGDKMDPHRIQKVNNLMVVPNYKDEEYDFYLGLAYISAILKSNGFNVFCIDLNHKNTSTEEQLSNYILENDINIVFTGGMSVHYKEISEVLDTVKKIYPKLKTIVGGGIVTSEPMLAMQNMKIDIGIIGEGEKTVPELVNAITNNEDIAKVKGIVYFDGSHKLITTEPREQIENLDSLPMPDYEGFDYGIMIESKLPCSTPYYTFFDTPRPASIITSRSCPFRCTFCYHPLGKKYRQRSLDHIFLEINYLVKQYGVNILFLVDELFSAHKERMYEFARRIKPYNIKWMTQLRVSDVDSELLKVMKESGLYLVSYGIENLSDDILKSMRKGTTRTQIERALELTHKERIAIQGNILFGDPAETEDTIRESLDWWKTHKEYAVNLALISAIPDSPIYRYGLESGVITDKMEHIMNGFPIVNLTKLSNNKFQWLCNYVNFYSHMKKNFIYGKLISSTCEYNKNGRNFYKIIIKCPECETESEYKNMHQRNLGRLVISQDIFCKHCATKLRLNVYQIFFKNYSLGDKIMLKLIDIMNMNTVTNRIMTQVYLLSPRLHKLIPSPPKKKE